MSIWWKSEKKEKPATNKKVVPIALEQASPTAALISSDINLCMLKV